MMKENLDVFFGRRSIRAYQDREISDEIIDALLQAAMAAPSCCCTDPWRFIIVREKEMLSKISKGLPNGKMLPSAKVGIVVCGDLHAAHGPPACAGANVSLDLDRNAIGQVQLPLISHSLVPAL